MKKTIALILTLAMAAAVVPGAVSAAEGPKTFRVGGNRGDWYVRGNDYTCYSTPGTPNFGLYALGNALDGEVELSADLHTGFEQGFMFGITDVNNNDQIAEADDHYYIVELNTNNEIVISRCEKGWDPKDRASLPEGTTDFTLSATYTKTASSVTITASVDGKEVASYTDDNPFEGVGYGLISKAKNDPGFTDGEPNNWDENKFIKNVVAPDLRNSAMSLDLIAEVEENNPKITYKTGSAKNIGDNQPQQFFGSAGTIEAQLENLFDDVNDPETSRFCVKYAMGTTTITWETNESEVAAYIVIYGGPNVKKNDRSMASFRLYGSTDGENWEQIASVGRVHLRQNNSIGGVHLDNDTAYNHYRIDMEQTEGAEIESLGIHLYAAVEEEAGGTEGGNTESEKTEGGNTEGGNTEADKTEESDKTEAAPTTGSAAIAIAAVAVISLAGVVVATKKREQD